MQIIFHARATKYRSLLRKMTYKDKGSYESLPPCTKDCAAISRLLKIIDPFCRILSLLQGSFAKETYNFKESTNRSHPISMFMLFTRYRAGCAGQKEWKA